MSGIPETRNPQLDPLHVRIQTITEIAEGGYPSITG